MKEDWKGNSYKNSPRKDGHVPTSSNESPRRNDKLSYRRQSRSRESSSRRFDGLSPFPRTESDSLLTRKEGKNSLSTKENYKRRSRSRSVLRESPNRRVTKRIGIRLLYFYFML